MTYRSRGLLFHAQEASPSEQVVPRAAPRQGLLRGSNQHSVECARTSHHVKEFKDEATTEGLCLHNSCFSYVEGRDRAAASRRKAMIAPSISGASVRK